MKIKSIKAWSADLGNTKPYTIAFKTVDEVLNVFVEITLENGVAGIGAGNPSEYVTGESFKQTTDALSEGNIDFLVGRDIRELNLLLDEVCKRLASTPAACAAIDIALHDAFSKFLRLPLVKYLGQKIQSLPTSNTIGIKNVVDTLKEAEDYGRRGFKALKVKIGKDLEEDIERLVKLREKFGNAFLIRVDANQGYTSAMTLEFFRRTSHLDLELVEQPLPARAVAELRLLPEGVRRNIAADESLLSPSDALELLQSPQAAGIFNIKLMKCGGVHQALQIARIASIRNTDLFWGCNDESIVSITAALHAAFACSNTRYIDLDGSLDLTNDPVVGGFVLKDGMMTCSDKPGLGVERV